jgi:CheY-like chemotaxis protein
MADVTIWRVLCVDDDPQVCKEIESSLDGEPVSDSGDHLRVHTLGDFNQALEELKARHYDLVILDVLWEQGGASGQEEGIKILNAIKQRRFVPVIFYTKVPHSVRDLETPLIRVVKKLEGTLRLLEVVKELFLTGLPAVHRALVEHMEAVERDYMWNFVAEHWAEVSDEPDHTDLAYLLARRLALSLSETGIQQLAQSLGGRANGIMTAGKVHPMRYYIMPPVEPSPLAGDIYWGEIAGNAGYWVLLTPSCDMVAGREKAERVVFAGCDLLLNQPEYQKWQSKLPKPSKSSVRELSALLADNRRRQPERFYTLPGALVLPDLIVDFQQLFTMPRADLDHLERISSLDSPYAEALLARFARYFGRLGTPDLDVEAVMTKLQTG